MRRLHALLEAQQYQSFREALACAEITDDISEFHVLRFRAILAMVEESGHAEDYLELAETVASSPLEQTIIEETLAAHDLLRGDAGKAAERCLILLDRVGHTSGPWVILLIALTYLQATVALDHIVQRFAKLNSEWVQRLAGLLCSEPSLGAACARSAGGRVPSDTCPGSRHRAGASTRG